MSEVPIGSEGEPYGEGQAVLADAGGRAGMTELELYGTLLGIVFGLIMLPGLIEWLRGEDIGGDDD